jgi:hypothetical protein
MLHDDEIESLIHRARISRFAPGFGARVLQRARRLQQQSLGTVLQRYFIWLVPPAVTVIALLAIHNARSSNGARHSIDAVLALQAVTLDAAYTFDAGTSAP